MLTKAKRNIAIAVTVFAVITLASLLVLRTPEPRYQGIPIHVFLDQMARNTNTSEAYTAVSKLGTNCLPYVITALAQKDSATVKKYEQVWKALPAFAQKILPSPKPVLQDVYGANIFGVFGCDFIDQDIRLLKHKSPSVRRAAAWSFTNLVRHHCFRANKAIPALIEALDDPDEPVVFNASISLMEFGPDATNAIPSLARILGNTNNHSALRAIAACDLGKIGRAAANCAPTIKLAMQSTDPYLRGQATVALWRVTGDVSTTLPVLLAAMPTVIEYNKWDWIIALGEMGPRAKAAVPQLEKELQQDKQNYILDYVKKSISQIQPEEPSTVNRPSKR